MEKKNVYLIGFLILTIVTSGIIYVELTDKVRIRIDEDRSTIYVPHEDYDWIWVVGGREYNRLFDGNTQLYRDKDSITVTNYTIDTKTTVTRYTKYKRGPVIIDIYKFDGSLKDVEMFPISHTVEILNGKGYLYRYTVDELTDTPYKVKLDGETELSFGRNIKVDIHPDYRWAWIGWPYGSDSVSAQYDIKSDYEVFNVRLFDPISSVTLNSPVDNYNSTNNSQDFNFTVSGGEDNYSCELYIDGSVAGTSNTWGSHSLFSTGLPDVGSYSTPEVDRIDGELYLISGNLAGTLPSFDWNGTSWNANSTFNASLTDIGDWSAPTLFENNSVLYLIIGYGGSNPFGFNWTGSAWQDDNVINDSLTGIGTQQKPYVFQKDDVWYLTSGSGSSYIKGFNLVSTESGWASDTDITNGINHSFFYGVNGGLRLAQTVFEYGSRTYMIIGELEGTFYGYRFDTDEWVEDSDINDSLADIGNGAKPTIFLDNGIFYMISGKSDGTFLSYIYAVQNDTDYVIDLYDTIDDGTYSWYINCTYTGISNQSDTRTITINDVPDISFISPTDSDNSYVNRDYTYINLSITEANEDTLILNWNGVNQTLSNHYINKTGLSDGVYTYYAWINDTSDNQNNTATRTITIDTTNPEIEFVSPTDVNNANVSRDYTYINLSITETNEDTVIFNWNGTNQTLSNDYINKTSLSEGTYTYYAWINDTAGNTNQTETRTILIDTIYPEIDFVSPTYADNTRLTVNYTYINWTITETNEDTVIFNWNGTNTTMSNDYINKTDLSDGNYTYYVWINDTAGKTNQTETRTINIDVYRMNLSYGPTDTTLFRFSGCGPGFENATVKPENQTSVYGIDYICNSGYASNDIQIKVSESLNSGWTWYASNTSVTANLINLTTSFQTIYSSLSIGSCVYIWHVANCSYVTQGPGAYEIYQIVES